MLQDDIAKKLEAIYEQTRGVCPECLGSRYVWDSLSHHQDYPCPKCQGTGQTPPDIKRVVRLAKDQDLPDCLHGDIFGSCPAIKANSKRVELQG